MPKCDFCDNEAEYTTTSISNGFLKMHNFCKNHAATYTHDISYLPIVSHEVRKSEANSEMDSYLKKVLSDKKNRYEDIISDFVEEDLSEKEEKESVLEEVSDLNILKDKLKKAISEEDFSTAASLRDEINKIEKEDD